MTENEAIRIAVNTLRDDVGSHMEAADIIEAAFERLRAIEARAETVRDAWDRASNSDDYPQGFGWPGDLYDALEGL